MACRMRRLNARVPTTGTYSYQRGVTPIIVAMLRMFLPGMVFINRHPPAPLPALPVAASPAPPPP